MPFTIVNFSTEEGEEEGGKDETLSKGAGGGEAVASSMNSDSLIVLIVETSE